MLNRIYRNTVRWIARIAETVNGQRQLLNTLSKAEAYKVSRYSNKQPIETRLTAIAECRDAFREFLKYLWKIMLDICQEQINPRDNLEDHPDLFDPAIYHVASVTDYVCLKFPKDNSNRSIILPPTNDFPGDKRRIVERILAMKEKPEKWFFKNTDLKPGENFYDYSTANIIRKHSVTDLGRKSFYIECMECIKTREGDWDKVEKCSDCIFSKKCVKEGTSL
jgi:hypothetical protein